MPRRIVELGQIHNPSQRDGYSCTVDYRYARDRTRYSEGSFSAYRSLEETNAMFFKRMIEASLGYKETTVQVRIYSEGVDSSVARLSKCNICDKWTSFQDTLIVAEAESTSPHTTYRCRKDYICRECLVRDEFTPELQECSICGGYQQCAGGCLPPNYGGFDSEGEFCCSICGEDYVICSGCNRWTEYTGMYDNYCESCRREGEEEDPLREEEDRRPSSSVVHDYSFKPSPLFHHFNNIQHKGVETETEGERIYLGVELEIDKVVELNKLAKELIGISQEGRLFYLKWDSSLEHGFEIVSQPCTLKYHRAEFPWKEIMKRCQEHDAKSDDALTCGLHVHFNVTSLGYKNQEGEKVEEVEDYNLLKLIFIIERFWVNFEKFARRKENHYCERNSKNVYDKVIKGQNEIRRINTIKDMKHGLGGRMAINLGTRNQKTIELRLFKGTLKYETFIATLEMVDYIIHFIRDKGVTYIYKLSWDEFVTQIPQRYAYLVNYLQEIKLEVKQCA